MNLVVYIIFALPLFAVLQDDLPSEIDIDFSQNSYASAVFKGLKIVNFESTKPTGQNSHSGMHSRNEFH